MDEDWGRFIIIFDSVQERVDCKVAMPFLEGFRERPLPMREPKFERIDLF